MIRWLKALFHLDQSAVCSLSGEWIDFHNSDDSDRGYTEDELFCRHCGKGYFV